LGSICLQNHVLRFRGEERVGSRVEGKERERKVKYIKGR
jgi:hypothetical protein